MEIEVNLVIKKIVIVSINKQMMPPKMKMKIKKATNKQMKTLIIKMKSRQMRKINKMKKMQRRIMILFKMIKITKKSKKTTKILGIKKEE